MGLLDFSAMGTTLALASSVNTVGASKLLAVENDITIETFDDPVLTWTTMNDPVMGGKSYSTVEIEDGVANFDGEVAVVPFLNAPGFIQMITRSTGTYPDVSSCTSLSLNLMATEPYTGYRISFGNVHLPESHHAYGFKADFSPPVGEYGDVVIPFSDFSSKWDEATGDTVATCAEYEAYCPDADTLRDMQTIAIWGEGVEGEVHLKVKSISATGCMQSTLPTPMAGKSVATSDSVSKESRYAEAKASTGENRLSTIGGCVGFAALLSLAILNHVRWRRNSYSEVVGDHPPVNEVV